MGDPGKTGSKTEKRHLEAVWKGPTYRSLITLSWKEMTKSKLINILV